MKVIAEDVAPSLRFHSAKVVKAARSEAASRQSPRDDDPWANDEPPF